MKKRRMWFFLLTVMVLLTAGSALIPAAAAEIIDQGTCGENLTWTLDDAGTLTISGTGEMDNWALNENQPWDSRRSEIQEVIISDGVTSIGDYAFFAHGNLTSVRISGSVAEIGEAVFYACGALSDITVSPDNGHFSSEDGVLFDKNKTTLLQYPLGNERTSYDIPEGVTAIGGVAFDYCGSLTRVTIPESVTDIEATPFDHCTALTEFSVSPDNAKFASEDGVLFNKDKTILIEYPIGNERTSYAVPDSVTAIGHNAFSYGYNLTSLTIGPGVSSIGADAFYACYYLTSVEIPEGIKSIGERTFYQCVNLTSVTLPDSVESIGDGAFYMCSPEDVYYNGTEEQWGLITFGADNDALKNAAIHYLTDIKTVTADEAGLVRVSAVNVPEDASVFLALYDSEGRLDSVEALSLLDGIGQKTVSLDGVKWVWAFVWENGTMRPLCVPGKCEI